jgi:hypothetical protein
MIGIEMKKNSEFNVFRKLFAVATDNCSIEGVNSAYSWEDEYAKLIAKEIITRIEDSAVGDYGAGEWDRGYDTGLAQATAVIRLMIKEML